MHYYYNFKPCFNNKIETKNFFTRDLVPLQTFTSINELASENDISQSESYFTQFCKLDTIQAIYVKN